MINFSNYGQERDIHANEDEYEIYLNLKSIMSENGLDPYRLELVRRSDNYVTAVIGEIDLARFKFTQRARWILFPYTSNDKIRLESPDDLYNISTAVIEAVHMTDDINAMSN